MQYIVEKLTNTKVRTYINAGVGCGGVIGICRGGDGRCCGAGGPFALLNAAPPEEDGLSVEVLPNKKELPDPDPSNIKVINFEYFSEHIQNKNLYSICFPQT